MTPGLKIIRVIVCYVIKMQYNIFGHNRLLMYFSISAMNAYMATMYEVKKKTTKFSHRHIIFLKLSENYEQCKCNAAHSETSIMCL